MEQDKKHINLSIVEILKELENRINQLKEMKEIITNNILEITNKIEPYKTYEEVQIATTGSIYIHIKTLSNGKRESIRIGNHKKRRNNRQNLLENIVYENKEGGE